MSTCYSGATTLYNKKILFLEIIGTRSQCFLAPCQTALSLQWYCSPDIQGLSINLVIYSISRYINASHLTAFSVALFFYCALFHSSTIDRLCSPLYKQTILIKNLEYFLPFVTPFSLSRQRSFSCTDGGWPWRENRHIQCYDLFCYTV